MKALPQRVERPERSRQGAALSASAFQVGALGSKCQARINRNGVSPEEADVGQEPELEGTIRASHQCILVESSTKLEFREVRVPALFPALLPNRKELCNGELEQPGVPLQLIPAKGSDALKASLSIGPLTRAQRHAKRRSKPFTSPVPHIQAPIQSEPAKVWIVEVRRSTKRLGKLVQFDI